MFYIKKDSMDVRSRVEYPLTTAHSHQFVYINGYSHYLTGDSEVKCDEGDKFESAFGKELAETNATIDMLRNYKSFLIRKTKQPEWRKEKKNKEIKEFKLTEDIKIPVELWEGMHGLYALSCGDKIYISKKE